MSFEFQFAAGSSALGATATYDKKSADNSVSTYISNLFGGESFSTDGELFGGSFATSIGQDTATSSMTEAQQKVSEKIRNVNELNIGGSPPVDGDWKTWAATVKDRAMPVAYKLAGIWTFMNDTQTDSFYRAFVDIYDFDLNAPDPSEVLSAMHFGVSDGTGLPISSYSFSSNSNYRTKPQPEVIRKASEEDATDLVILEGSEGVQELPKYCDAGSFACGMDVRYDDYKKLGLDQNTRDEEGIFELKLICCPVDDWNANYKKVVKGPDSHNSRNKFRNSFIWREATCPFGEYIVGAQAKEYNALDAAADKNDPMGITGIKLVCSNTDDMVTVFESFRGSEPNGGTLRDVVSAPAGLFARGAAVKYVSPDGADGAGPDSKDDQGITGLTLYFESSGAAGPPHNLHTYNIVWEGSDTIVSAPFATAVRGNVSPNLVEDGEEAGLFEGALSGSFVFFGLMSASDPSKAVVAVSDFEDGFDATDLSSFSYLTADNLPGERDLIASVVHPLGYAVNEIFGSEIGFELSMASDQEYIITFDNQFDSIPTFITFPLWFSSSSTYPLNVGQLSIAPRECSVSECTVAVGAPQPEESDLDKHLGFAFLALDTSAAGVIHGTVAADGASFEGEGFTVESGITSSTVLDVSQLTGGIKITFDAPFRSIPSVVVSAHIGQGGGMEYTEDEAGDEFKIPVAIVEHINRKQAYIKCGWISDVEGDSVYGPLPFSFVVTGPPQVD